MRITHKVWDQLWVRQHNSNHTQSQATYTYSGNVKLVHAPRRGLFIYVVSCIDITITILKWCPQYALIHKPTSKEPSASMVVSRLVLSISQNLIRNSSPAAKKRFRVVSNCTTPVDRLRKPEYVRLIAPSLSFHSTRYDSPSLLVPHENSLCNIQMWHMHYMTKCQINSL